VVVVGEGVAAEDNDGVDERRCSVDDDSEEVGMSDGNNSGVPTKSARTSCLSLRLLWATLRNARKYRWSYKQGSK
jgi:hypothetical protein